MQMQRTEQRSALGNHVLKRYIKSYNKFILQFELLPTERHHMYGELPFGEKELLNEVHIHIIGQEKQEFSTNSAQS